MAQMRDTRNSHPFIIEKSDLSTTYKSGSYFGKRMGYLYSGNVHYFKRKQSHNPCGKRGPLDKSLFQ
jgi:hypothetical protein